MKTLQTTYKAGVEVALNKIGRKYQYTTTYANGNTSSSDLYSSKKVAFESYQTFCQGIAHAPVPGLIHLGNGFYVTA